MMAEILMKRLDKEHNPINQSVHHLSQNSYTSYTSIIPSSHPSVHFSIIYATTQKYGHILNSKNDLLTGGKWNLVCRRNQTMNTSLKIQPQIKSKIYMKLRYITA